MKTIRQSHRMFVPLWIGCLFATACSLDGDGKNEVTFTSISSRNGMNFASHTILLRGKNLGVFEASETPKKERFRLEMWTGSSKRLGRGFSLENPTLVGPNLLRVVVPPGVYPGSYRLVVRKGRKMRFTKISYLVTAQDENRDTPFLSRITPSTLRAGDPRRITFIGANLIDTIRIALEGPLPEKNSPLLKLKRKGFALGWPLQGVRIRHLKDITNENPARVSASVPSNLPPGRYTVRLATTTHKGHPLDTDNMVTVTPAEKGTPKRVVNYLIYFGVLGTIFLLGMIMAWRQGDVGLEQREGRINLLWMVGGLVFYAVLIGSIQFYFSRLF